MCIRASIAGSTHERGNEIQSACLAVSFVTIQA